MKYLYKPESSNKEGEGPIYRNTMVQEAGRLLDIDPENNATTMYELLKHATSTFRDKQALGFRDVLETYHEKKTLSSGEEKTFSYNKLSDYHWITFSELDETLVQLSSAMKHIGLKAQDKVTFYAPSTHKWLSLAYAMFFCRAVVTTVYDTLGEDGLLHGLTQCESPVLYLAAEQLHILRRLRGKTTYLKNVIYTGTLPSGFDLKAEFPDYKCYSWDELIDLGKSNPASPDPPKPDDLAIVMYTSGSTGPPKGVMLTHSQLVAAVAGIHKVLEGMLSQKDVFISFLPLSHIFAFIMDVHAVSQGIRLGFGTPRTLMDSNVRNCCGDLTALKPTVISAVPQVFDTIHKEVLNKINRDNPSMGELSALTGGCIRFGLCGAAPLSNEVSSFYESSLFPLYQGYGMTEMGGVGAVAHYDLKMPPASVGQILPSIEIKLVDVPDAGYFAKENKGELWVRGPCVTSGYFKNPKATEEAIEADGNWLRTGDIARLDDDGCLYIIDRRKNLVKLINGEYIAIEKLESIYRNCIYVQSICIVANSFLRRPVAIIHPNLPALASYAKDNGLTIPLDLNDVSGNEQLTQEVFRACMAEATNLKLNSPEKMSAIFLSPLEFTVESNFITPSQKINRRAIESHFKAELEVLFKSAK